MRIKKLFAIILSIILFVIIVYAVIPTSVYAADNTQTIITEEELNVDNAGIENVADGFINYLKERYGDEYDYYYGKIIDNWGSVEAYLLSFGEKLPEEHRTGWQKFVGWLDEYASVWAPALAVAVIIIVALIGKKQFNALVDRMVNAKLRPIVNELNVQSKAMVTIMHSQKALLGNGERFAGNVNELEESEKEITNGGL